MATYPKIQPGPRDPARSARQITPSNTTVIPATRGIHCTGDAGIVLVQMVEDAARGDEGPIPLYITKGGVLPVSVVQVLVDSDFGTVSTITTTATGLIALY